MSSNQFKVHSVFLVQRKKSLLFLILLKVFVSSSSRFKFYSVFLIQRKIFLVFKERSSYFPHALSLKSANYLHCSYVEYMAVPASNVLAIETTLDWEILAACMFNAPTSEIDYLQMNSTEDSQAS